MTSVLAGTQRAEAHRISQRGVNLPRVDDVVVVIPSHRTLEWGYLDELSDEVDVVIVDDSADGLAPGRRRNVRYFAAEAQERIMGQHFAAIPHGSSATRNFGHFLAWHEGYSTIISLDSDCRLRPGWLKEHLAQLGAVTEAPAVQAPWVDTIGRPGVFARGFPYECRDDLAPAPEPTMRSGNVKLHMGLWDGILDMNGVDKFEAEPPETPVLPVHGAWVVDGRFPLCGMNVSFSSEITPAMFFIPDFTVAGWRVSRHDDIWGGYIAEALLELNGDLASFGGPVIEHTQQTPLDRVVVLEHYQHLLAERFYDVVDRAVASVRPGPYPDVYAAFTSEFEATLAGTPLPGHYRRAFEEIGAAMARWAACFV
jgi:hypothetical protein